MSLRLICPNCKGVCLVDPQHLGLQVRCGRCGEIFPAAGQPTDPPDQDSSVPSTVDEEEDEELLLELDGPAAAALGGRTLEVTTAEFTLPVVTTELNRIEASGATTVGRVRSRNEDSMLLQHLSWCAFDRRHELLLAVVADGMGGHDDGDLASSLVIRTIAVELSPLLSELLQGSKSFPAQPVLDEAVRKAIVEANRVVHTQAQRDGRRRGMGATLVMALVIDGSVTIGHVGDCRAYSHRGEELTQITRDQTLAMRMVDLGQLTLAEASTHPARNEVFQAVGAHAELDPSLYHRQLARGDWLVLACDGLHAHVPAGELSEAILASLPSAAHLSSRLVQMANLGGGSDNCTVIAVRGI